MSGVEIVTAARRIGSFNAAASCRNDGAAFPRLECGAERVRLADELG